MSDLPATAGNSMNNVQPETLVILGASTRAAAFSALRAGWQPHCGDLFADVDLQACSTAIATADYPLELEEISRRWPPGAWLFTGGLENEPAMVERISASRPLLGNAPDVLRKVRDPLLVARVLAEAGFCVPRMEHCGDGLPTDGTWLRKKRHSSGGSGVQVWHGQTTRADNAAGWYFQQRVAGASSSALYLAAAGQARLIGVSEQLVGDGFDTTGEFRYRGSLGPLALSDAHQRQYEQLGSTLAGNFNLVGLFGVDTIADDERIWPIEINPRYTASAEIFEYATRVALLAWHVQACREGKLPQVELPSFSGCQGKRVIYARRDAIVPLGLAELDSRPFDAERLWRPIIADIPAAGSRILRRHPVLTIFAEGTNRAEVCRKLDALEHQVDAMLYGAN